MEFRPAAHVSMLVRRPVAEVFRAVTDPNKLTQFWLARSSGPLEQGRRVHWEFMVPGAEVDTFVRELEIDKRILIDWSDGSSVDWRFESLADGATLVNVTNVGFKGSEQEAIEQALEATQGFTIVLCDLKLLLEHGASLNLVRDKARLIEEQLARKG